MTDLYKPIIKYGVFFFIVFTVFISFADILHAENEEAKLGEIIEIEEKTETQSPENVDENGLDYEYSANDCDFTLRLPKEPYISQKCTENGKCETVVNFTKIFNASNAVNFRVICKKYPDAFNVMNEEVLRASVLGMAKREYGNISDYEINYADNDDYKVAMLTGAGSIASTIGLYTTQLWIGSNSVMSFEGEVIGNQLDQADELFANISSSIKMQE